MNKIIEASEKCSLFKGLSPSQINSIFEYISPRERTYKEGEFILRPSEHLDSIGIITKGKVHIIKDDLDGSTIILTELSAAGMFGESFALSGEPLTVSAVACTGDTTVIFIPVRFISGEEECPFSPLLSANLMKSFAAKNLFLTGRIEHLTKRTLSHKVMAYLKDCSLKSGSDTFTVPFDRQAMADYLAADRSALSAVLGRLKREGKILYRKNSFTLLGGR